MPIESPPPDSPVPTSAATSLRIVELMKRRGIKERQCSSEIARILDISYSQAHRKVHGNAQWMIDEVQSVVRHFDTDIGTLLKGLPDEHARDGVVSVAGHYFPCRIGLGDKISTPVPGTLVAVLRGNTMHVGEAETLQGEEAWSVTKIEVFPQRIRLPTVAVLDDDSSFVETMATLLQEEGFEALACDSVSTFLSAIRKTAFDLLVIDWVVGGGTAEDLVQTIRALPAYRHAPLFILTGNANSHETGLANAVSRHGATFIAKPVPSQVVVAQLRTAFRQKYETATA
jgi:CheY-like chemotaxis protein